jgi:sterol desaturase/sphingolipid hydroxylase (fatty acid hydroxylase superfamily)
MVSAVQDVLAVYIWNVAQFLGMVCLCVTLELLAPADRVSWSSRWTGLGMSLIQRFAGAAVVVVIAALPIRPLINLPAAATIPMTIVYIAITDLPGYWLHRASHTFAPLWRLHSVHHSVREVSAVTAHHGHFLEEFVVGLFQLLPLAFLVRFSGFTAPWLFMVPPMLNVLAHSNTRFSFGPLNFVLFNNRVHRIHHSIEPRHFGKNYSGIFTIWDVVFGTAYFPADDEWPSTGVDGVTPTRILDYLTAPFLPSPGFQLARHPSKPLGAA